MPQPCQIALAFLIVGACLSAQSRFPTTTILSTTAPTTVAAGQQVPLRVSVVDSNGYLLPTSGTIQFFDGAASLGPAVAAPTGIGSFSASLTAGSHNLRAQFSGDAGLSPSASTAIGQTVVANACPQLVFTQSAASVPAGSNIGPVIVQVACGAGVSTVNLTALGLGGFKPGSVTSAPVVNGLATFNNLALNTPGAYALAATATGATGAISNTFTIAPAGPTSVFSVTNTQDAGPGSYRDAFNQANLRGGVITFQDGLSGTVALASPLPQVLADLQIVGPGARVLTISGSNLVRLLFIQAGTVAVSGITLSDGVSGSSIADAYGPGIENLSSSPVSIDNCVITNNSTPVVGSFGGGIHNKGKMALTNSTVSYNKSGSGGGVDNGGTLTIANSLFLGNISAFATGAGGAIMNEAGANLTITNSTINGNTAAESGGGLANLGSLSIADSTITRNQAQGADGAGGALVNQLGGTVSIARCAITSNAAIKDGGAIANMTNGSVTVTNTTFAANSASGNGGALINRATASASFGNATLSGNKGLAGGGIYNEGNGSQLSLKNSILSGNTNILTGQPDDCVGCGVPAATNLVGGDPKLGALQDNGGPTFTMLPLPGSPVIGAGSSPSAVATDQRGQPRPATGSGDIGAVQTNYSLAFATQPQNAVQGAPITAAVQLQESGRPFAPAANQAPGSGTPAPFTATLALASGTGKLTGNVAAVDANSGLAQFPAIQVDTLGAKSLRASVPTFVSATSQPFTISTVPIIPASIVPTGGNGQSAVVNSDFATLLQVTVQDATGAPLQGITVVFTVAGGAAFGGGSPTTVAITDATGVGVATTLTAGAAPGPAIVSAGIPGYSFQATFTLTVAPNPSAPAITAAGFLNDASFLGTSAAPNTIMAAFGTFPCARSVVLQVNGTAAEILSASTGQVNFTVPASVAGTTSAAVTAACGTVTSQTIQLPVAPSAPGVFTLTQTGKGQAAALNQNGVLNNALNPASAGQIVSLFVTGLGALNPAGADRLQHTALPIQAFLGGTQATVQYAGNAPGFTLGLQQVNIIVPPGVSGLATALTLNAGGTNSQAGVTLAIQ